jgi:16S rRNA U1498 N3-methylase RsmE
VVQRHRPVTAVGFCATQAGASQLVSLRIARIGVVRQQVRELQRAVLSGGEQGSQLPLVRIDAPEAVRSQLPEQRSHVIVTPQRHEGSFRTASRGW